MEEQAYVEGLLQDAYRMVAFARGNRSVDAQRLWGAIVAVKALPPEDVGAQNPSVVELQSAVRECSASIDPQVLFALRAGWSPFDNSLRKRTWIGFLVVVSLLSIGIVGQLTQIYNSGRLISNDLIALQEDKAQSRFGQLERELYDAQQRLADDKMPRPLPTVADDASGDASASEGSDQQQSLLPDDDHERYLLAREAAHQKQDELIALDQKIRSLQERAFRFQERARYPIYGMRAAEQLSNSISGFIAKLLSDPRAGRDLMQAAQGGEGGAETRPGTQRLSSYRGHEPRYTVMREVFCRYLGSPFNGEGRDDISSYIKSISYTLGDQFGISTNDIINQNCSMGLYYYSGSIPDVASLETSVRDTNAFYSFIVLPAAYGALGALMYYMRRILDPLLPNPTLVKTLRRVALGALAGVLLAWLWGGIFETNDEFKSVGLGLLALAFLFGFSIEVFFDLLDRLVLSAKRSVGKIGEQQEAKP